MSSPTRTSKRLAHGHLLELATPIPCDDTGPCAAPAPYSLTDQDLDLVLE